MIGVGVGFDTKGSQLNLQTFTPNKEELPRVFEIPDTREGWVQSLQVILESYLRPNQRRVEMDYSQRRKAGIPLKTFGGSSSGPGPLIHMHDLIR